VLCSERQVPLGPPPPAAPAAPAALAALYVEHFKFIWRSLRRLGVRESSLDDAVQDVFLVAHRKLGTFEGRSSHRVWLFAIALRVAREEWRRDGRLCLDQSAVAEAVARDDALEQRRRVLLLDELLNTLSTPLREVFVMAEVEGFSAPEIAEALGVKLNTVYSRLRLGRRQFERALARQSAKNKKGTR
jgi:RNA polymerase sigma-70 factor (ECF subfamily)